MLKDTNGRVDECIHGHPYDQANTIVKTSGRRLCRICKNASARRNPRPVYEVSLPLTPSQWRNFWTKVSFGWDCWEWTAAKVRGYGRFGRKWPAHRLAYEMLVGPIPDGLTLDHLCRNKTCIRPDHLEPVTGGVNTLRGNTISAVNAAKTHCDNGHPLSGPNLRVWGGVRICRECKLANAARRRRAAGVPERGRYNIARSAP